MAALQDGTGVWDRHLRPVIFPRYSSVMDEAGEYELNVGRPHENLPDDRPDVWQWRYRGSKAERDGLLERLADDVPEPVEQEALW